MKRTLSAVWALLFAAGLSAFDGDVGSRSLLPLVFEPNRGQAPEPVRFLARRVDATAFLTDAGLTIAFADGETSTLRLLGAAARPETEALEPTPEKRSIQIGSDRSRWVRGLATYGRVRFRDVYPNIDLEYYADGNRLEYDFVVHPGGDPQQIRFEIDGGEVELTDAGAIRVLAGAGAAQHSAPYIYQETGAGRLEVAGAFQPAGERRFGFELGRYDAALDLVIDPEVPFSSDAGGPGVDIGFGIDFGPGDELWACGDIDGATFLGATGVGVTTHNIYVARLGPDNTLLQTLITGGSRIDSCGQVDVNDEGDAYGFGRTNSPDFPRNPGDIGGGFDFLLFHVGQSSAGDLEVTESRTYGGPADEGFNFAKIFPAGSEAYYLLGGQTGGAFPGNGPGPGGTNAFLLAINEDLEVVATDFVGGPGDEYIADCDLKTGLRDEPWRCTGSSNSPTIPGIPEPNPGGWSGFTLFDAYLLGDIGGGSFYSTPETENRDFFVQAGMTFPRYLEFAQKPTEEPPPPPFLIGGTLVSQGQTDGYVALVDENGDALSTWMRPNANITDLAIDGADMIGAYGHIQRGPTRRNIFLSKLDPYDGLTQFDDYVHPADDSFGQSIAVDSQGQFAMTGGTREGFQRNGEPLQDEYAGGAFDAFLLRTQCLLLNPMAIVDGATFTWHPIVGLGLYSAFLSYPDEIPGSPAPLTPDGKFPTEHDGIAVEIGGVRVPVIFAGLQTNFQAPASAFDRDVVDIEITHNGTRSNPVHLPTAPRWPTFFEIGDGVDTWAAALRGLDGSVMTPDNGACREPLVLFGNNFGRRNMPPPDIGSPYPFDKLFEADPSGVEIEIRPAGTEMAYPAELFFFGGAPGLIIDQTNIGFSDAFWTFAAGLTTVEYELRVTDTVPDAIKVYTRPDLTPFQPIQDTSAFATCP